MPNADMCVSAGPLPDSWAGLTLGYLSLSLNNLTGLYTRTPSQSASMQVLLMPLQIGALTLAGEI